MSNPIFSSTNHEIFQSIHFNFIIVIIIIVCLLYANFEFSLTKDQIRLRVRIYSRNWSLNEYVDAES